MAKKTAQKDLLYTDKLGKAIGYDFVNLELKLDKWGSSDNYSVVGKNNLIVAEIELSVRHPECNVTKLWPYLEQNPDVKVVLVQLITTPKGKKGVSRNRKSLCQYVGKKLEVIFGDRFRYLYCENDFTEQDYKDLKALVAEILT